MRLPQHLSDDLRDRRGGAVHAEPEVAQVVELLVPHLHGEIAALHLCQRLARRPQPAHDPRQHGDEGDAGECQDERFLEKEAPTPLTRGSADRADEPEARQVKRQRLPRLGGAEVQRRLQGRDQIGGVHHVPSGPEGVQHGRDQRGADREVEVDVPGSERLVAGDPVHRVVRSRECGCEPDDEPPRDGHETPEAYARQQRHPDAQGGPARSGVREDVVALFGAGLFRQLRFQGGGRGHADKMSGARAGG